MIYRSNPQGVNFIQSLSRMWRVLFAQSKELETAYKAAEHVWAQAYLDLLQDRIGVSLENQEVFRKLMFRHTIIHEELGFIVEGFLPNTQTFLFPISIEDKGWKINNIKYIGNSLIAPSIFLEEGVDYEIVTENSQKILDYQGRDENLPIQDYVAFFSNPFANSLFPLKWEETAYYSVVSPIGASADYTALGIIAGDLIHITFDADLREFYIPVASAQISKLLFAPAYITAMELPDVPLYNRGFTFRVTDKNKVQKLTNRKGRFLSNTTRNKSIPVWFSDLKVDDYALSQVYGELLGHREISSDNYKKLLQGLLQYYVRGVSLDRTTSAVHVIAGLPVFDTTGETVDSITTTGVYTTIVTSSNIYTADKKQPLQDDVLKASLVIDGNTVDNTAAWVVFPPSVDLKLLGVNSSHILRIADGGGLGIAQDCAILKAYNQQRLMLQAGVPVIAGAGEYWGFSVGTNAPDYDNVVPFRSDQLLLVENFSRDTLFASKALQPITATVSVVDYKSNPRWWINKAAPEALLEDTNIQRQMMLPNYTASKIGVPGVKVGDPMFKLGADENKRIPTQNQAIVELPYFDKILSNNKEFREGELLQSLIGVGNGEGTILWHDKTRDVLFVKVIRGNFLPGDNVRGIDSAARADLGVRTRLEVASNISLPLAAFTATDGFTGIASGRIVRKISTDYLEVFERAMIRRTRTGDTLNASGVTQTILGVSELSFAPSHRNLARFMMEEVWQHGVLHVSYDLTSFQFPRGLQELRELVTGGAEGRVYVHIDPFTRLLDVIPPPTDTMAMLISRVFSETFIGFDTQIRIGGPAPGGGVWTIGTPGYIIGGANPAYTAANLESYAGGAAYADLAIDIQITI